MKVVVVESQAKAKTIEKYLGKDYKVFASYGHVRDLLPKAGSVKPDKDFELVWEVLEKSTRHVDAIVTALKKADELILATDPDREGEAISWHLLELLKDAKKIPEGVTVSRVTFNAITKQSILDAMAQPRAIDMELVNAYLARLSLDYLVGFTLSPLLWRKLPGSRSAGRVQSVALRLIIERDMEITSFKNDEYWTIEAESLTPQKKKFLARLNQLNGKKVEKFSFTNEQSATEAAAIVEKGTFTVSAVDAKTVKRHPAPPFTTSTLQQEASRKLNMSPGKTMQIAQRLYEGIDLGGGEVTGLITYMRTDSIQVTPEAIVHVRAAIESLYGKAYLPEKERFYKSKIKNAQEAHEAVRPTDLNYKPADVKHALDTDQFKIYELIWKRMIASQMESALFDQKAVDMTASDNSAVLRATGSEMKFDGFLKVYVESVDDATEDDAEGRLLPAMAMGDVITMTKVLPEQHFTQPPPRYSEASLIKRLEELGIGRPSTFVRILQVLKERDYVKLERKTLFPLDQGYMVTGFLHEYFKRYIEYSFTANMEEKLDQVSNGQQEWKAVLSDFWGDFAKSVEDTSKITINDIAHNIQVFLKPYLDEKLGTDPHCPSCKTGLLNLRLGKYGSFLSCSTYPECTFKRALLDTSGPIDPDAMAQPDIQLLGLDPNGLEVTCRKGPYGFYFQWGEVQGKEKPKRISLPKDMKPEDATLEAAIALSALPRELGINPDTGLMISTNAGRFGPYVKHDTSFVSLKNETPLTVSFEHALELVRAAALKPKVARRKAPIKTKAKTTTKPTRKK